MDPLKALRQEIHHIIKTRVDGGVIIRPAWLTTEVMATRNDIQGEDAPLYITLAYDTLGRMVKECIGKYEPSDKTDRQTQLPGFEHLQKAYPIVRDQERVLVPTDQLTDEEIDARCEDLEAMSRGCIAHAEEFRTFKRLRSAPVAKAS
jgi:hypothetical protein